MKTFKNAISIIKPNLIPHYFYSFLYVVLEYSIMLYIAPYFSQNTLSSAFTSDFFKIGIVFLILIIAKLLFFTGFISMILNGVFGVKLTIGSFKITKIKVLRLLTAYLIIVPIAIAGFLLLIVPGAVWLLLTIFVPFIVLSDESISIIESIFKSISSTKGMRSVLLGYSALYLAVSSLFSLTIPALAVAVDTLMMPVFYSIIAVLYMKVKDL
jgi:hypothetical protein